jgi:DNA-binding transcriptional LysR family regulator
MHMGELPIQDIATFVAVAQNASFTRAAEKLGTSKSNVGKAVQRLEVRLGARLLQRTTRAVRLTEDGELYLEAARAALDGLNEAEVAMFRSASDGCCCRPSSAFVNAIPR